jgi:hypothetical protein
MSLKKCKTVVSEDLKRRKQILLGQLASYGDCLYATAVARQIKTDFPGSHLTWAIGSAYKSILYGNPHVDEVWEFPMAGPQDIDSAWYEFQREVVKRHQRGEFQRVFLTQVYPANMHNYVGNLRASLYLGYGKPIRVTTTPVLRLTSEEVERVRAFAKRYSLDERQHVVLFECSSGSGQSWITPKFAMDVAQRVIAENPGTLFVLSTAETTESSDHVVSASELSFRENAELSKYCSLLVGTSSGISWLCTSDWSKPLQMIQLLRADSFWFASHIYDRRMWGGDETAVLELYDYDGPTVVSCINSVLKLGFATARQSFHQEMKMAFKTYQRVQAGFFSQGQYRKMFQLFVNNVKANGLSWNFLKTNSVGLLQWVRKSMGKLFF